MQSFCSDTASCLHAKPVLLGLCLLTTCPTLEALTAWWERQASKERRCVQSDAYWGSGAITGPGDKPWGVAVGAGREDRSAELGFEGSVGTCSIDREEHEKLSGPELGS